MTTKATILHMKPEDEPFMSVVHSTLRDRSMKNVIVDLPSDERTAVVEMIQEIIKLNKVIALFQLQTA